jgi:hypothetical protein
MESHTFLERHFQNAYVTCDLDRAMALLKARYDINDFIVFDPDFEAKTPRGVAPNSSDRTGPSSLKAASRA